MKIVATIEARMGSTRLYGKVLKPLFGEPMLERLIKRVKRSRRLDAIIVATTVLERDDPVAALAFSLGVECYRGSEDDLLGRVAEAVSAHGGDLLVSLTGDNPFIDPDFIDDMIKFYEEGGYQYTASTHMHFADHWDAERVVPRGISAQVLDVGILLERHRSVTDPAMRELGLFCIYNRSDVPYRKGAFPPKGIYEGWRHPELRMTVDTPEDFEMAERVFAELVPKDPNFSTEAAIRLLLERPDLRAINQDIPQVQPNKELQNI
ncbi:MAG: glycosyltransferase family protein [Magnetococcales bacterium]|nr:glycosyltransferase family protein [Magnetococcales bacterium]MBF0148975.1 glycosyltransferase family protein [Magnetococcales bacterium]MBF0603041.1 glycosyltransferase family protein [Magnetococcales bacterium]